MVALASFEALFVLFLLAGRFKADPRFAWVPIDITLLFLGLSILSALFLIILRRTKVYKTAFEGVMLYLAFSSWISFTLIWAPNDPYATDKVVRVLTLVFWAYAGAALIIANKPERVARFYFLLVLAAVWLAVESWLVYINSGSTEPHLERVLGGNYLGVGRVVGMATNILVAGLLLGKERGFFKTFLLIMLLFFFITLLIIGGRGPFIATLMSIFIAFLLAKKPFKFMLFLLTMGVLFSLASEVAPLTTLYRLQILLEEPSGGTSAEGRLRRIEGAWEQITRAPVLGQGVGSFYWYYGDPSLERDYPHNILLELAAETGLIGFSLFVFLVLFSIRQIEWAKIRQRPLHFVAILMLVNTLLNAMFSGDIPDNRLLFTVLGLLTGFSGVPRALSRRQG
ncbi:O-antigen ligase family protein [Thermus sp.]|uniref:O-antigen ligase family protein n=1 Tax=Thermus sp. TaxID=275 RepID=UPI00321FE7FE